MTREETNLSHNENDDWENVIGFAYEKPADGAMRFPLGGGSADRDGYERDDGFWVTGLKKEVKSWARYKYWGLERRVNGLLPDDPTNWPSYIPEANLPEMFSLQVRQSARIEWRTVGNESGRQRLAEELTKWGMKEGIHFKFFNTQNSLTCGEINFKRPSDYLKFLRMAGDYNIHDPKNSKGWRLHPYDAMYQYVHANCFVKPFIVEGLRTNMQRTVGLGQPQRYPNATIDICVNWEMMQDCAKVMENLNKYTLNDLREYHKDNFTRFQECRPLNPNMPSLDRVLTCRTEKAWLDLYERNDYTAQCHRRDVQTKNDWSRVMRDKEYGDEINKSSTRRADTAYTCLKVSQETKTMQLEIQKLRKKREELCEEQRRGAKSMTMTTSRQELDPFQSNQKPQAVQKKNTTQMVKVRYLGTGRRSKPFLEEEGKWDRNISQPTPSEKAQEAVQEKKTTQMTEVRYLGTRRRSKPCLEKEGKRDRNISQTTSSERQQEAIHTKSKDQMAKFHYLGTRSWMKQGLKEERKWDRNVSQSTLLEKPTTNTPTVTEEESTNGLSRQRKSVSLAPLTLQQETENCQVSSSRHDKMTQLQDDERWVRKSVEIEHLVKNEFDPVFNCHTLIQTTKFGHTRKLWWSCDGFSETIISCCDGKWKIVKTKPCLNRKQNCDEVSRTIFNKMKHLFTKSTTESISRTQKVLKRDKGEREKTSAERRQKIPLHRQSPKHFPSTCIPRLDSLDKNQLQSFSRQYQIKLSTPLLSLLRTYDARVPTDTIASARNVQNIFS